MKHQPYFMIFSAVLSIGGLISGIMAWLFLPDTAAAQLHSYTAGQLQTIADSYTWQEILQTIVTGNVMDMLRVYLCGVCLVGIPIMVLFLFLKCFAVGFSVCILAQSSIVLLLSRLLYLPALVFAVMIAYRFSLSLVQNTVQSPVRQLLQYTLMFLGILLCTLLVSGIDSLANIYYLYRL